MSNAARLPIVAPRVGACVRTILFRGVDLSGCTIELQARLNRDTPGAPLIDLTGQPAGQEGISIGAIVTDASGIPSTPVVIRIAEATMKDATKVPYMGELGDPGVLAYALVVWGGSIGADKRVLAYGDFIAEASAFGSDNAPAGRMPSFQRMEAWAGTNTATIQWDATTTVQVSIDGADVLAVYLAQGKGYRDQAQTAAQQAVTAASAFLIASSSNAIETTHAQAFSGATITQDALGRDRGLVFPSGQSGATSLVQFFMPIGVAYPIGTTVHFVIDITVSVPFSRGLIPVCQILTNTGATTNRAMQNVVQQNASGKIYFLFDYTIQGDEVAFWPYIQNTAGTATTSNETMYVERVIWRVTNDLDPVLSVTDLNLAAMQARALRDATAAAAPRTGIVTVKDDGSGDFTSLAAAMAAITDASASRPYTVKLYQPSAGSWPVLSANTKDYVDWEGVGAERVWLRGYQDPNQVTIDDIANHSTLDVNTRSKLTNLKVTAQNARYAVHADRPSMANKIIQAINCHFEHLGNDQAAAKFGSGTWSSLCGWGMGTWSGVEVFLTACEFVTPTQAALYWHNQVANDLPKVAPTPVHVRYCTITAGGNSQPSLVIQSGGMGQLSPAELVGNRFSGPVGATGISGAPIGPAAQEWLVYGFGNTGFQIAANSTSMRQMLTDFTGA